jgi:hypothetical protein
MTYIDYDRLDFIEEVVLPTHQWHELNVGKIHSVEGIDPLKKRIIITVSYKQ